MPEIGRIQSTNFQSLLTELGITRNNIPFALRSEVTPVVLVGGTVSFVAAPTPAYQVTDWFTAGQQIAPAAGFVLADTGPLTPGAYTLLVIINALEVSNHLLHWRNAADSADLRTQNILISTDLHPVVLNVRFDVLNDGERFTVTNISAGGVGIAYQSSIMAKV